MLPTDLPLPDRRPLVRPALVVALVLAALTGFVDAVAYDRFLGIFPANQSGNAVFLGTAIGGSGEVSGWHPAVSMAAFALAIVVGELLRRHWRGPRVGAAILGSELVLLVLVLVIAGPIDGVGFIGGFEGYVLIVLTSAAMGMQTTVIRHVAGTAVSTTYVTGAIDHVGAAVSRVLAREGRIRDERTLVVLLLVLVAYVGGAALGAAAPGRSRWAMGLAAAVVAVTAAFWAVAPRRVLGDAEAPQ
jgi:uncharacterized membrane protein YoaK (UPF0700 family)